MTERFALLNSVIKCTTSKMIKSEAWPEEVFSQHRISKILISVSVCFASDSIRAVENQGNEDRRIGSACREKQKSHCTT
jgi:hypothetical protein